MGLFIHPPSPSAQCRICPSGHPCQPVVKVQMPGLKMDERSTGFVPTLCPWQCAHASSERSKKRFGSWLPRQFDVATRVVGASHVEHKSPKVL
jgi:hypothetical protein